MSDAAERSHENDATRAELSHLSEAIRAADEAITTLQAQRHADPYAVTAIRAFQETRSALHNLRGWTPEDPLTATRARLLVLSARWTIESLTALLSEPPPSRRAAAQSEE